MNTLRIVKTAAACLSAAIILSSAQAKERESMSKDHLMMKDGKMVVMKEGKTMPMSKEMTLPDGTKVMPDGTVMMKDGTKKMMKNGEAINMNGMVTTAKPKR